MNTKLDRNIRFFGSEGQELVSKQVVSVAGIGGLGSHVIQQLAHLGVKKYNLIDPERLDKSNLNRYVGATLEDAKKKIPKVELGERIIKAVEPDAYVKKLQASVVSEKAFDLVKSSDFLIGCFDNDGPRFVMNELCSAYEIPYIDLASDIHTRDELVYGGRVATIMDDGSCLLCIEDLNNDEILYILNDTNVKKIRDDIYGVDKIHLDEKGPSVVSINGVIASLGITEFIKAVTKIRTAERYINYRGDLARITVRKSRESKDCFCCNVLRGLRENAGTENYLKKIA